MKPFVFFDLDGTLIDSMPYHAKAWIEALAEYGIKFKEEEVYLYEGAIEFETVRDIFQKKGFNIDRKFFEDLFKKQKTIFLSRYASKVNPFPEVPTLLDSLRKEKKILALVTSSHAEILDEVLPKNFYTYFSVVLTGDRIKKRKPHPDPYLEALKAVNADFNQALVVENSPAGVTSAKGANLFCVAITTTLPEHHLRLADLVVKDHTELKEVLLNGKDKM
ncbi:HAD family phosphatase [Thermodesulfobacterium sp. TA1]|uniref:HAD family hydrolase n=1 Tax=Thermodesulfobacterium sp. TA1 TaxID=2234087 RepID=UPI001231FE4B|nr:HAD family phosphatase [Thermodesulfobacterium sp. TA1]QER41737.1 HAD family phosphatase [Thermodesulfobacterium sp. TA1]